MPWEISFIRGSRPGEQPLGARDIVVEKLSRVLPPAQLRPPPHIPDDVRSRMPPTVIEAMSRRVLETEFDHPDLLIQFYCADSDPIQELHAEVRGEGDPIPVLKAICESTGWSVWDIGTETIVDLIQAATNWADFCEWRDRGIVSLSEDE